ncbi:MAG: hypothetical protein ACH350_00525 [Parachlamydiaceae bacterium]
MYNAVTGFPLSAWNYLNATKNCVLSAVVKCKDLRNNPDVYQKVGQIALATFQLIMIRYPSTAFLGKLSDVFSAVSMHDFCRALEIPRGVFAPIKALSIDECEVTHMLTCLLTDQNVSEQDFNALGNVVKKCVKTQLQSMMAHDDAYQSLDDFLRLVEVRLKKTDQSHGVWDVQFFQQIDLQKAIQDNHKYYLPDQCLRHTSTLQAIMNMNWAIVDLVTVAWTFKGWNLLDTAKYAEKLSQYRVFHWVKNQNLDVVLIGGVCTGFAWKILESIRKLRDDELTIQEKQQARWNVITSLAELTFFGVIFTNITGRTQIAGAYVEVFALVAKSLGLLSLLMRPEHKFFQTRTV